MHLLWQKSENTEKLIFFRVLLAYSYWLWEELQKSLGSVPSVEIRDERAIDSWENQCNF